MLRTPPHNECRFGSGIFQARANLIVYGENRFDSRDVRWFAPQHSSLFVKKVNAVGKNFGLKEQIVQSRPRWNLPALAVFVERVSQLSFSAHE